jgi:uncharacterized repeat protein (TIGR03803 family)
MKNRSISPRSRTLRLAAYSVAFPLLSCLVVPAAVHAQTLTTLHSFGNGTDGQLPITQLLQAKVHRPVQHSNGNFYGTTPQGGVYGAGTVYQLTPQGAETTLYSFCSIGGGACTDGASPLASLVVGSDGNLYGTTYVGGANNLGTIFKITTTGALTTLYSFSGPDGANPEGALVQGSDGNLYGTTYSGGANNDGTVFKISCGGALITLHSFNGSDGLNPLGDLLKAKDGNFNGATFSDSANTGGTVFEISPAGTFSTLYTFCSATNCTDGQNPLVPLVQDSGGDIYGATANGGANGSGTLFVIEESGLRETTTVYNFCSQANCTDGANPVAGPLLASDGNLYGTTLLGGNSTGSGTVFEVSTKGILSTVYDFCSVGGSSCTDGATPEGALIQGTNGTFYGTTAFGGTYNLGTAFSISLIPPAGNACNGVYDGEFDGNITVSAGQTCEFTNGGFVKGNIHVLGGTLILQNNATVKGNVDIDGGGTFTLGPALTIMSNLQIDDIPSGSAQNTICGVTVNGNMHFEQNAVAVEIGAPSGCQGNVIGGDLHIADNTAAVQVFNNTIKNNLQCDNNSSITGAGNTAKKKQDQCSTF